MTEALDRDLHLWRIVGFGVGLVALIAVVSAGMWLLVQVLTSAEVAEDPPPPVLPEARQQEAPPEPRLQTDPFADLAALRAAEDETLEGWAWTDEGAGLARVPVERAMELLLEERPAAGRPEGDAEPAEERP